MLNKSYYYLITFISYYTCQQPSHPDHPQEIKGYLFLTLLPPKQQIKNLIIVVEHEAPLLVINEVMGFILGQNRVIAKDVKNCNYCCYLRCAALIFRIGGMPWSRTGATQYHGQLGLSNKCLATKWSVVYNSWDLGPLDLLNDLALRPLWYVRKNRKRLKTLPFDCKI